MTPDTLQVLNLVPWKFLCLANPAGENFHPDQRESLQRTVTALAALGQ